MRVIYVLEAVYILKFPTVQISLFLLILIGPEQYYNFGYFLIDKIKIFVRSSGPIFS